MSSSSSTLDPPMENDFEYLYGRVDAGTDENVFLVEAIAAEIPEDAQLQQKNILAVPEEENHASNTTLPITSLSNSSNSHSRTRGSYLSTLPGELINLVLSFLGPIDLISVSSTCRLLSEHSRLDIAWQRRVQDNIPGVTLTSPSPCATYRELYIAHDPHWFLPKYKVWFSDYFLTGTLMIIRYDPRRGCIEGYRLVAERPPPTFEPWEADDEVIIHSFEPRCRLHLDQPLLQLDVSSKSSVKPSTQPDPAHRFSSEIPMLTEQGRPRGVFSNFMLARPVEERPNMQLWPPRTIPARHRVRNASQESFVGRGHKPQRRSEASNQSFRIRRWMEMPGAGGLSMGLRLGEEIYTYATLDPKLYTPTEEKPFRGIWIGDYSGHGCEFLLMHQPENEEPFDEASVVQAEDETPEDFEIRKKEERIYRGSLQAIKLTGDPNIPRGEYTFIADDISNKAFVRHATEKQFGGARMVRSRGHIAERMFLNNKYIESQLIMISHDKLAQYWVGFGHISYFERVNIDEFLSPYNDRSQSPLC